MNTPRYPAEWEEQDGVLLAWPHEGTDWKPYINQARETFARIIAEASHHGQVIVVTTTPDEVHTVLRHTAALSERVHCFPIPSNDTWARDFGPITIIENDRPVLLDFLFNGWGGKFHANFDNVISKELKEHGVFSGTHLRPIHFVLEGGSIESDGHGTLLTTTSCNANPNRNAHLNRAETEETLKRYLGVSRVLWLEHGYLAGDDTDGHVDMLARFAPHDTLIYQACDDPSDEHFAELSAMANELGALKTPAGTPYRLLPLPWPSARHDEEGHRLPVSYANFLVLNGAVLVPVYTDPQDHHALDIIGKAFPGRKIIGIDCSALILQHGSLHCVTMQLPKGVLG
ncbi:MAG: agmatine deiminase family protein [bacterium]